jgi:hypothetical protein
MCKTTENPIIISSEALAGVIGKEKKNNGAVFTINSKATGKDFTYAISRKEYKDKWYTHVRVETGYMNFTYLGSYFKGQIYRKGVVNTPAAKAIAYVLKMVEAGHIAWLDERMEVMHTGNCLSCGRVLTDANSIKIGLGPICANY